MRGRWACRSIENEGGERLYVCLVGWLVRKTKIETEAQ